MPSSHRHKSRPKRSSSRPNQLSAERVPGDPGAVAQPPPPPERQPRQEQPSQGRRQGRGKVSPLTRRQFRVGFIAIWILLAVSLQGRRPLYPGMVAPEGNEPGTSWFTLSEPALPTIEPVETVPSTVKALYYTSWSAGVHSRMEQAIALIHASDLNAVVIDLKDFSGKVAFETSSPLIKHIGSEQNRIGDLRQLVQRFHQEGIYVIGRIAVFQDQHLIMVRPDLAVRNASGGIWRDRKGLGWVDPASREVWEYAAEVAREAAKVGVDELNFDYVRFPSDGSLESMRYPFYNERKESKHEVIRNLFAFLADALAPTGKVRSVDLFGLATVRPDDLGIGQLLEDALLYFDFVCPMVYPSHYARGFLQFRNPAAYPYEVIHYSLATALAREDRFARMIAPITQDSVSTNGELSARPAKLARLRPWLQAFDLGAVYSPPMIHKEMQAVYDVGLHSGWYLWNPANVYDPGSLEPPYHRALNNSTR